MYPRLRLVSLDTPLCTSHSPHGPHSRMPSFILVANCIVLNQSFFIRSALQYKWPIPLPLASLHLTNTLLLFQYTSSCCWAIDNFVSRRRLPLEMYSDNGTNFVAASKMFCTRDGRRPLWRFNPPGAPHMGGSSERLVVSVKQTMHDGQKCATVGDPRPISQICLYDKIIIYL